MNKRETTHILKGDRGWHAVVSLPEEHRDVNRIKEMEDFLSVQEGRYFYDFRIDPETWLVWLKQKDMRQINYVTSREEK